MAKRKIIFFFLLLTAIIAASFTWLFLIRPGQEGRLTQRRPPDYGPLRRGVMKYVSTTGLTYGIYFKDLSSGATWSINAAEPMLAASTTKIPVVLYLNTLAAAGKVNWQTKVTYNRTTDFEGSAGVLEYEARTGDKYSLRVLANLSVTTSDNIANRMLLRYLGKENIARFMTQLGGRVVYPDGKNMTCAEDLAKYMEAVLDFARREPKLGNRLLDDMANSVYHVGLPGLLPEQLVVAHKEGNYRDVIHDFGVVFSRHPYILVIMSKGTKDLDRGFGHIARISRMVYDYQENLEEKKN